MTPPIVSFPKSGRTWLRYAASLAGYDELKFTHAGHASQAENLGIPFVGIPDELKSTSLIFMHRNPLDTAVSYFFQILHKDCVPGRKTWRRLAGLGRPMPPYEIEKFVLDPVYGIDFVCTYNRAWLDHLKGRDDCTVLKYEDFHSDPEQSFGRFFDAIGAKDVDIPHIVEETSFQKMKRLQDRGEGDQWRIRQSKGDDPESGKVRKGQVRGYKLYLEKDTINECRRRALCYGFKA